MCGTEKTSCWTNLQTDENARCLKPMVTHYIICQQVIWSKNFSLSCITEPAVSINFTCLMNLTISSMAWR